jgi:hypothetical protein
MAIALRIGAVGVWVAGLVAMATWGATTLALAGAALGTFALGLFVGRWWVLLAVAIPGLVVAAWSAAGGIEDTGHGSGVEWALWLFIPATILVAAIMALGVLCHRIAVRERPSRPGRGPLHAR